MLNVSNPSQFPLNTSEAVVGSIIDRRIMQGATPLNNNGSQRPQREFEVGCSLPAGLTVDDAATRDHCNIGAIL